MENPCRMFQSTLAGLTQFFFNPTDWTKFFGVWWRQTGFGCANVTSEKVERIKVLLELEPPALGGLQIPRPMGWWFGLAPATLDYWVRFPNERIQAKHAHPVSLVKYRVPHGSHYPPPPTRTSL
jgi:hypothetical protein